MAIYKWKCTGCDRRVEVIRSVKDIDVPPNSEDIPQEPYESCKHPKWERLIGLTQPHQHGSNWTGRKGHWVLLLAMLSGLLAAPRAYAYRLLDADDVSMEGYRILDNRDAYWPYANPGLDGPTPGTEHWTQGAAANLNLTLLEVDWARLYWDNRVHGESTNVGFREVGWQYELGVSLTKKVDVYWDHHSEHLLDATPEGRFPLQNFVGVRVHFYRHGEAL